MFRKFTGKEDISTTSVLKSSVQRNIRKQLLEQYPALTEEVLEALLPKKSNIMQSKCRETSTTLFVVEGEPLFFQHFDGPIIPTLRTLHKFPDMMPKVQIDTGAIKFILSGADIMCPGLTSAGGRISADLAQGAAVAVMAQDRENAVAIGILKMSGTEIIQVSQGRGVENIHYLNDGLWRMTTIA